MLVQSSANKVIFTILPKMFIPRILSFCLIARERSSMAKINIYGESGHPCLTPRWMGKTQLYIHCKEHS